MHIDIQDSFTDGAALQEAQHVPDQTLLTLVRYLLPKMQAYYTSENEGQKEIVTAHGKDIA